MKKKEKEEYKKKRRQTKKGIIKKKKKKELRETLVRDKQKECINKIKSIFAINIELSVSCSNLPSRIILSP